MATSEEHAIMKRTAENYAKCLKREQETLDVLSSWARLFGLDENASLRNLDTALAAGPQGEEGRDGD